MADDSTQSYNLNNSTVDFNDELYIHHGDTSNNFMLASQRLNGDNYGEWKRIADIFLSAKNKLGFVTGYCIKPASNSAQFNTWERCNNLVITWILHYVKPDIKRSILYLQTATEIHKQISSITQGNSSVASYYTQLKTGWDEYMSLISLPTCTCGSNTTFLAILQEQQVMHFFILQEQQVMHFLMGLNDNYKHIRGNILMMQPLPSLSQVYRLILQEDKQRGCNTNVTIGVHSIALVAPFNKHSQFSNTPRWHSNNGFGLVPNHNAQGNNFGIAPNGRRSKFFCTHCNVWGHSLDRCFKANPNNKDKGKRYVHYAHDSGNLQGNQNDSTPVAPATTSFTQDQVNQLISLLASHNLEPSTSNSPDMSSAYLAGAFKEASSGPW